METAISRRTVQKYVWMNLEIDLLDVGASFFDKFHAVAARINRLKCRHEITGPDGVYSWRIEKMISAS